MPLHIIAPGKKIKGEVSVPLSKSESNRILLIKALAGFNFSNDVFSDAQDTVVLKQLLQSNEEILNAGDGAATVRFLMAYCVARQKQVTITGSESLCKRPMNDTVDLLKQLGAQINIQIAKIIYR
jgi:3-phosphoshikimate 1-carboxyvinyltransferase